MFITHDVTLMYYWVTTSDVLTCMYYMSKRA